MLLGHDTFALRPLRTLCSLLVPLALIAGCAPSGEEPLGEELDEGAEGDVASVGAPVDRRDSAVTGNGDAVGPRGSSVRNPAPSPAPAAPTYQVGPGKPYASLQAVAPLLKPGDVVEVYAKGSAYAGDVIFTKAGLSTAKITIRGVRVNGARPIIAGGTSTVEFRGNHYVFEGFDVTGGSSRVLYHHADGITVRDTVVHDCLTHGILGADDDSGSLTLEYVEVARCGSGDQKHPIYIATDESAYPNAVFRMQHCYVHDGQGGNNVKSRAGRNEIYYNWIEGAYYRELELIGPDGQDPALKREDSDIVGNVFYQTKGTYAVRVGGDGTGATSGRYRFLNNTFVLRQGGTKAAIQAFDQIETLELHNNVFSRLGGGALQVLRDTEAVWVSGAPRISGSKNWAPTGSTGLSSALSATVFGADPKFVNAAGRDLRPAAGSQLVNAAATTSASPSGFSFLAPLPQATFVPPPHALQAPGTAQARVLSGGLLDIGAFE